MNQEFNTAFHSEITLNPDKIITYKGEDYDVDFDLIRRNCKYFNEHRSEFESEYKIEIDLPIDLPQKTIQTFLSCNQYQLTYVDDMLGINYLSIKYQNEKLLKFTQDFIEKNYDKLIFQSILFKDQIQQAAEYSVKISEINIDTSNEERILSAHFIEYMDDERIFTLPITFLDRVMKNFIKENKEIYEDEISKRKIHNFLFKCLEKYKKPASVLFLNMSFDKLDRDLIITLHNEFADVFDFNMINVKSLFDATYELIGENSKILLLIKDISERQKAEINAFNEYKLLIEQKLEGIRTNSEQNQIKLSSKIQKIEENQNNSSERIQSFVDKNNDIEERIHKIDNKQNSLSEKIQTLECNDVDRRLSDINGRIQTLENEKDSLKSQIYQQKQDLNGISQKISTFATREISTKIQSNLNIQFM